ncbi:Asp-tRNA(Asn)/Glu-tRNA(Gln) amidotransferase subunit GatC [Haliovirga abyssi]|uniref:Aspartyl/glutamyl-tRNA(Asn/Gln) amidotransferase subunit C n=1 Tax=Haliovirga abyssi TaxID=2996794 RepID=A0AAU9DHC5_9FUSO|nr:Asp-tRNA(Asn)/Glu-tRNA(Gln) amidotransferase subunit GatC [Haliovirga abyssi]BDU50917.1 aspartyl/glutamyl-tRNA(Asn/Gln) amidotransferase subunit C [Haliovirga abyssi]
MALTKEDVLKIAGLSRLEFKEEEVQKFQSQLNDILKYVDKLSEVDTENVEPLSHAIDLKNALREDVVKKSVSNELAMKNAPQEEEGTFIVPKVVG